VIIARDDLRYRDADIPLRLEFARALYHVTARGDRREPIYEDDEDRSAFLDIFGTVIENFNWVGHAGIIVKSGRQTRRRSDEKSAH
jgi:hypothetical protein